MKKPGFHETKKKEIKKLNDSRYEKIAACRLDPEGSGRKEYVSLE